VADDLDTAFEELRGRLGDTNRLAPTHSDPFFNFVHDPAATMELHRRLPRWAALLDRDGWNVRVQSMPELVWKTIGESGRWDEWLELEQPGAYRRTNDSVRDVLRGAPGELRGLAAQLAPLLADETPGRVLFLTGAGLLHPWYRVRTLETTFHDRIHCRTVLFYPGRRAGQYGLHFLGYYPEDGNYRSTIVGGMP
jgi:hypothetical protein